MAPQGEETSSEIPHGQAEAPRQRSGAVFPWHLLRRPRAGCSAAAPRAPGAASRRPQGSAPNARPPAPGATGRARPDPRRQSSARCPETPPHPPTLSPAPRVRAGRCPPAAATAMDRQERRAGHTGRDTRGPDSGKIKDPPTLRAPSLTLLCTCSAPPRCGSPAPATRAGCWRTAPPWTR